MEIGIRGVAISSIIGGLAYWVLEFFNYLVAMMMEGLVPFDALIMLISILIFSFGGGMVLGVPSYMLLKRLNALHLVSILVVSLGIADLLNILLLSHAVDKFDVLINSSIAGLIAGIIFYLLLRPNNKKIFAQSKNFP